MPENSTKKRKKSRRGRPPKHGGYSLLATGELTENRKYIKQYLTTAREGLIADYGPTEEDLSTAQLIIIDRAISKMGILRCMEEYCREGGVMKGNNLAPCLRSAYLSYGNSLRLDLQALKDLGEKKTEEIGLAEYVEKKYGKKEGEKKDD